MPFSEINISDWYSNPVHYKDRFSRQNGNLIWQVMEKKEGMIEVQAVNDKTLKFIGKSIWVMHTDRMFSIAWKVWDGKTRSIV